MCTLLTHPYVFTCAGYWCGLWLAYMHMVLLGVDLLRMYNNRATFDASKQECGFFNMLDAPNAATATAPTLLYPGVYHMADDDLHGIAALLATLLLAQRMRAEKLACAAGGAVLQFHVPRLNSKVSHQSAGFKKTARGPSLHKPSTPQQQRCQLGYCLNSRLPLCTSTETLE